LLSIKDVYKYYIFCEWFSSGGFAFSSFSSDEKIEYVDIKEGFTIRANVDYCDGRIIYPIEQEDIIFINKLMRKL